MVAEQVLGLKRAMDIPGIEHAADSDLELTATVDGASLAEAGANKPVELRPTDSTEIAVEVTNNGSSPVEVRSVLLVGVGERSLSVTLVLLCRMGGSMGNRWRASPARRRRAGP